MKKNVLIRCLCGAPLGLAISTAIAVIISLCIGDGQFYAVAPQLAADCGSELNAVIAQALCSLLYGAAWAGASVIWQNERWSLLKQSVIHLVICSLATFPIAYFMRWMEPNAAGILSYFAIFLAVYAAVWLGQYIAIKRRVALLNDKMRETQNK